MARRRPMGAIHRGIPPDQRRRRFSTPARRARSMMRRLSFTFFPFPTPRQRRLRARDMSIAVISIPSPPSSPIPRPRRDHFYRDAPSPIRRLRGVAMRARDARRRRVSPRPAISSRRYLHHLDTPRPSVRPFATRRDAFAGLDARDDDDDSRARARRRVGAGARDDDASSSSTRGAARDRATDARGGRRARERAIGGVFE